MAHGDPTVVTPSVLRDWALPKPDGDKSSRGTVLVVGGSRTTPGAVLLAGTAAMRAGAGKLQLATASSVTAPLAIAVPEAMVVGLREDEGGVVTSALPAPVTELAGEADVILIGPGLISGAQTAALLEAVLDAADDDGRVVVDANALRALAERPELLKGRAVPAVITPNLDEGSCLLGRDLTDDLDREAATLAGRLGCVVSLFGHVADPDGSVWRDEIADEGLGTSGSGDVAAGIVAGLLARGAGPAQAAAWAAFVHATCGQRLAATHGRTGYVASDIVDQIGATLLTVEG